MGGVRTGLALGKYAPFHAGHEHLIRVAVALRATDIRAELAGVAAGATA